jgi:ubiquinone/menaquinone biosynthesis C-methylase UbiE
MTAPVYDRIGATYAMYRRADPRIAARISDVIGDARRVLNVGAGTGSYEPDGAIAVEPSRTMIDQRRSTNAVVQAVAERLPLADQSFDVALAVITVHHWPDVQAGLAEMRRVAARQVVVTFDWDVHDEHWIFDYVPAILEITVPPIASLGFADAEVVEVPWDCIDQFLVAPWRRPEAFLDPAARAAMSGLALLDADLVATAMDRLAADLRSGEWARKYGHLLALDSHDVGLRILS